MEITFLRKFPEGQKKICKRKNVFIFLSPIKVVNLLSHLISAARFGNLEPFGLLLNHLVISILIWQFSNLPTFWATIEKLSKNPV